MPLITGVSGKNWDTFWSQSGIKNVGKNVPDKNIIGNTIILDNATCPYARTFGLLLLTDKDPQLHQAIKLKLEELNCPRDDLAQLLKEIVFYAAYMSGKVNTHPLSTFILNYVI